MEEVDAEYRLLKKCGPNEPTQSILFPDGLIINFSDVTYRQKFTLVLKNEESNSLQGFSIEYILGIDFKLTGEDFRA
jgi:hypothetical protein